MSALRSLNASRGLPSISAAAALWPAAGLLVVGVGVAIGTTGQAPFVVGALGGIGFLALAILRPVPAVALFFLLTFISQLSVVGPGLSIAKGAGGALVLAWLYRLLGDRPARIDLSVVRRFASVAMPFLVWCIASALWASDASVALSSAARIGQGPLLVIVIASLVRTRSALTAICYVYIVGATLSAIVGFTGVTHAETAASASTGRLYGGIGDPNFLAAVLVLAVVLALFMFLGTKNTFVRAALSLGAALCLAALFLTESRGGIVALAVAVSAAVAFAGPVRRQVVIACLLVGALASVYLLLVAPPQILGRLTAFQSNNGTGRTDLWTVASKVFQEHPIQGIGLGNFTVVEPNYAASINQNLPFAYSIVTLRQPVHNTYLHIAAELGVVGESLFVGLLAVLMQATKRGVRSLAAAREIEFQLIGRGLFIGALGMLSAFTFLSAQYEKQLWLTLGMLLAFANLAREDSEAAPEATA